MKNKRIVTLLTMMMTLALQGTFISNAFAQEDEIAKEETIAEKDSTKSEAWLAAVKDRYKLTDEQMKALADQGLKGPGISITAQLAEKSGKPIEEVAKMRTEQKMGWGKIAKELGVHPGEIGKSVSSLRHEVNGKKEDKLAKEERKAERKEEKKAEKEERRAKREERKAKHEERKEDRKDRAEKNQEKSK